MAACKENMRVRLTFVVPKSHATDSALIHKYWYLINTDRVKDISELTVDIVRKFGSYLKCGKRASLQLRLDGCILPAWESVHILRDNDVIDIQSIKDVSDSGEGYNENAVKEDPKSDTPGVILDDIDNKIVEDAIDTKHKKHKKFRKHKKDKKHKRKYSEAFDIDAQLRDKSVICVEDFTKCDVEPNDKKLKKSKGSKKCSNSEDNLTEEKNSSKIKHIENDTDVEPDSDINSERDGKISDSAKCSTFAENFNKLLMDQKIQNSNGYFTNSKTNRVKDVQDPYTDNSLKILTTSKISKVLDESAKSERSMNQQTKCVNINDLDCSYRSMSYDNQWESNSISQVVNVSNNNTFIGNGSKNIASDCTRDIMNQSTVPVQDSRVAEANKCREAEANNCREAEAFSSSSESDSDGEVEANSSTHLVNKRQRKRRKRTKMRLKNRNAKLLKKLMQNNLAQPVNNYIGTSYNTNNNTSNNISNNICNNASSSIRPGQKQTMSRAYNSSSCDHKQHKDMQPVQGCGSKGQLSCSDNTTVQGLGKSRKQEASGHIIFDSDVEDDSCVSDLLKTSSILADKSQSETLLDEDTKTAESDADKSKQRITNKESPETQSPSASGIESKNEKTLSQNSESACNLAKLDSLELKTIESFAGGIKVVCGYQTSTSTQKSIHGSDSAVEVETNEVSSAKERSLSQYGQVECELVSHRNGETRAAKSCGYAEIRHPSAYGYEDNVSNCPSSQEEHEAFDQYKNNGNRNLSVNGDQGNRYSRRNGYKSNSYLNANRNIEETQTSSHSDHIENRLLSLANHSGNESLEHGGQGENGASLKTHKPEEGRYWNQNEQHRTLNYNQQGDRLSQIKQGKSCRGGAFRNVEVFTRQRYKKAGTVPLGLLELNSATSNQSIVSERPDDKQKVIAAVAAEKKDYTEYPLLSRSPTPGDHLAFKIMELDEHYTPRHSDYKEGVVTSYNHTTRDVCLEDIHGATSTRKVAGRFDIVIENDDEIFTNVEPDEPKQTLKLECLVEPRLLT